jgi:2-amino-4-hydroxy-6-hydroxymethyldihydropteridine diphosphokinase
MNTAYLLMGGNLGDRLSYLQQATSLIQKYCGNPTNASAVYETAAWGLTDQPSFYNQALAIHTTLTPENLMKELLRIETAMGRERTIRLGPRTIDLDILLIDQQVIASDLLTLPHPFLPERRFALTPLCEIAPDLVHPVLHKTIRELLDSCPDNSDVQKKSPATN